MVDVCEVMFENVSCKTWHKRLQEKWNVDKGALVRAHKYFRDNHGYDIQYEDCFVRFAGDNNLLRAMSFSLPQKQKGQSSQQNDFDDSSEDYSSPARSTPTLARKRKRGRNYSVKSLAILNAAVKEFMPHLGT